MGDRVKPVHQVALTQHAASISACLSVGRTRSSHDSAESLFGTPKDEWFHHRGTLGAEVTRYSPSSSSRRSATAATRTSPTTA